jgi:OOP family OmpA-OmpF porin
MKRKILFIFLILSSIGKAQSLVVNGDFEEFRSCPIDFNQSNLYSISNWMQVGIGTPDYFNACSRQVGVPKNVFGNEPAHSGSGYAGLILFSVKDKEYREYLFTKLTKKLNRGDVVCVEAYLSCAEYAQCIADQFGFHFSEQPFTNTGGTSLNLIPSINGPRLFFYDNPNGWLKVGNVYTAQGGEEYLTIGNFSSDKNTKVLKRTAQNVGFSEWAYVYIDDVTVRQVKRKEECSCENDMLAETVVNPPNQLKEVEGQELDKLYFEFDKSDLTDESIVKLQDVYKYMRTNEHVRLIISGHTDAIGSDSYNMELSKMRASAAIQFLETKGIDAKRMEIEYFGAANPATSNDSDNGRAQNRRVEFRLVKMKYTEFN